MEDQSPESEDQAFHKAMGIAGSEFLEVISKPQNSSMMIGV
jgi:hypothetical protein